MSRQSFFLTSCTECYINVLTTTHYIGQSVEIIVDVALTGIKQTVSSIFKTSVYLLYK
jgi:hypothetical protein